MERRNFLKVVGRTAAGGLIVAMGSGCGSSDGSGGPDGGGNPDPDGLVWETSTAESHSHTFEIPLEDLEDASGNKTYTSSSVGHTHTVTLTAAERDDIAAGTLVSKTTSDSGGHTHDADFLIPDSQTETTTNVESHTHTFTIPGEDLVSGTTGNRTYTSSSVGHTHQITVSAAARLSIADGGPETFTTTSSGGHTHGVTFVTV